MDDIKYLEKRLKELFPNKLDIKYTIEDGFTTLEVYDNSYPFNRLYSGIINNRAFENAFGLTLKNIHDSIKKRLES